MEVAVWNLLNVKGSRDGGMPTIMEISIEHGDRGA